MQRGIGKEMKKVDCNNCIKLWDILDDIDTASDIIKPTDEGGYRKFYDYVMTKVNDRFSIISSDGYSLFYGQSND